MWNQFYNVYLPLKSKYDLRLSTKQSASENNITITQKGKIILKVTEENLENAINSAIKELDAWEKGKIIS